MGNIGKPIKIRDEPAPIKAPIFVPRIKVPEPARVAK